jgi:hypothetical protein
MRRLALLLALSALSLAAPVGLRGKGEDHSWDLQSDDPEVWLEDLPEKFQQRDYSRL